MPLRNYPRGIGGPAQVSAYMGHLDSISLVTKASGTAQGGYVAQGDCVVVTAASASHTEVTLPDPFLQNGHVGDSYFFVNDTTQACVIFPPTGGVINGGSANASCALAANKSVIVYVTSVASGASRFVTNTGA